MVESEKDPLGRLIYDTAQDIRNIAERYLCPFDLTVEQMHLLKNLTMDSGVTQKTLGAITNKTPANLTRLLDRLEGKTLIERRSDPGDRRAYLVFLTEKGMNLIKDIHDSFQEFSSSLHSGITDDMQQIVRTCLERMRVNIERMNRELKKNTLQNQVNP